MVTRSEERTSAESAPSRFVPVLPEVPGLDRLALAFYGRAMTRQTFHCDRAEWRPLESILSPEECEAFMYMGWLELGVHRLHHYKHVSSRRYLFVTDALETYRYVGDCVYVPQARKGAIRHALEEPT